MDKKEIIGWYEYNENEDIGVPITAGLLYKTKDAKFYDDESFIGFIEDLLKEFHKKKIKITVEVIEG